MALLRSLLSSERPVLRASYGLNHGGAPDGDVSPLFAIFITADGVVMLRSPQFIAAQRYMQLWYIVNQFLQYQFSSF